MSLFESSTKQRETALLVIRVVLGAIFIAHGGQKLFQYGIAGTTGAFTQMGIPFPELMAPFISGLEFFGGIALIVGFLTRLAGLGLALNMLGAFAFVHLKSGFFAPTGYEFVLALFAVSLALAIAGAGAFSVDSFLANRRNPAYARKR